MIGRTIAIIGIATGCLDEPDAPPGHNHELRHVAVVGDVDGDGFDDLITLAHDGDPRRDSFLEINFGNKRFGAPDLRQSLAITDARDVVWYEPLAASVFHDPSHSRPDGIVVMSAQDPGLPPDDQGRWVYVSFFQTTPLQRTLQPAIHTPGAGMSVGGYAPDPQRAFVFERMVGPDVDVEYGDPGRVLAANGMLSQIFGDAHFTTGDFEYIMSADPVSPSVDSNEPLLVVTTQAAYLAKDVGPSHILSDRTSFGHESPREVTRRTIDSALWLVATNDYNPQFVSIVRYTNAQLAVFDMTTTSTAPANDLGVLDAGGGRLELASIEDQQLVIYDLPAVPVSPIAPVVAATAALPAGSDLLAIGKFDGSTDEIYVLDSTAPTQAPSCFVFAAGQLGPCP